MFTLLLVVIYIAFISLGLPDSLLGSAWPLMYEGLRVPVSYAGVLSMIIAAGTIVSSLLSDRLIRRLGTGMVTLLSVAMTAVALLGFSFSGAFWVLCLWCVPYGLGAGSVDAALNNFVALHYKSRHMSWLHCFWGIGATAGPFVMGLCLSGGLRWMDGYRVIGLAQVALVAVLALSLPLWKRARTEQESATVARVPFRELWRKPVTKRLMLAFFCYCSLESTTGLWASSYLVLYRGIATETAARMASIFYLGITAGRLISGFLTTRFDDRMMVRIGQALALLGALVLLLPMGITSAWIGLILIGLGCAPIYPSLLHQTPAHFGAAQSQSVMGLQMASAYTGTTLMPLLFGAIAGMVGVWPYPLYLLLFTALMLVMTELVCRDEKKEAIE